MTLACQGNPGLATKMSLMHPSTELNSSGCSKFATIVLTQTIAALVEALPGQRSEQIQRELEAYLAEFYGPDEGNSTETNHDQRLSSSD